MPASESHGPESRLIFDIIDFKGRRVFLTERTFQSHLGTHPEVDEYRGEAQEVIHDPNGVIELENGATVLYRVGLGRGKYLNRFLCVYIRFRRLNEQETGVVATYFFQRKLPTGALEVRY